MQWELPTKVTLGDKEYDIRSDYREILQIIAELQKDEPEISKYFNVIAMFYPDFEKIPEEKLEEAEYEMIKFINCGEEPEEDGKPAVQKFDWEQDGLLIVSDINRNTQKDIRSYDFLHWWTFLSLFNGIGEGQLSTVVSIREKKRKGKKLDDWEKEFYKDNRKMIVLKKHYSKEEQEERERLNALLNG